MSDNCKLEIVNLPMIAAGVCPSPNAVVLLGNEASIKDPSINPNGYGIIPWSQLIGCLSPAPVTDSTSYTSTADGTTIITLNDSNNNALINATLLWVQINIQPLKKVQYSFNPATAQLLLEDTTLDMDSILFVLYQKPA